MENNYNNPTLLLVLCLSLLLPGLAEARLVPAPASAPSRAAGSPLEVVCRKTDNPKLCASSLAAHLDPTASLDDPMAVFQASLKAALAETVAGIHRLDAVLRTEKDAGERGLIDSCKSDYDDAVDKIGSAMKEMNFDIIRWLLNSSMSFIGACIDDLSDTDKVAKIVGRTVGTIDNAVALGEYVDWDLHI